MVKCMFITSLQDLDIRYIDVYITDMLHADRYNMISIVTTTTIAAEFCLHGGRYGDQRGRLKMTKKAK